MTVQQVSGSAGELESYFPYAGTVIGFIREKTPDAQIYFHQTWAYEKDSNHPDFGRYDRSQQKMFGAIKEATVSFCASFGIPYIPCGEVIQRLRSEKPFRYEEGGMSLCRDGFHMSLLYGRYALAATWFEKLFRRNISASTFVPSSVDVVNGYKTEQKFCEPDAVNAIRRCVHSVCSE